MQSKEEFKVNNMNDLEFYRKCQENASFLKAIFEMFLKCNDRWKENYIEIIGTEFHRYGNWDLHDEYIKFNDDVFKCYILTSENQLTICYFEFSDFQNWQESRKKK